MTAPWERYAAKAPASFESQTDFDSQMNGAFGAGKWKQTSGYRTPWHNAAVHGVDSSHHMDGTDAAPGAHDVTVAGMSSAQIEAKMKGANIGGTYLPEGDHLHVTSGPALAAGGKPWERYSAAPAAKTPAPAAPAAKPVDAKKPTPQDRANAWLAQHKELGPEEHTGVRGAVDEFGHDTANAFTFGLSDAMGAGISAAESQAGRLAGKDPGFGFGEGYNAARAEQQRRSERHPGASGAGNVAGTVAGIASGATELKGAKAAGGLLARGAKSLAMGAGYGAVGGAAGSSRYQDVLMDTAMGGGAGALMGALGEAVISGGRAAFGAINSATNSKLSSAFDSAAAKVRKALEQDGIKGSVLSRALSKWQETGVDQSLMDLGGKNLARLISRAGGGGGAQHMLAEHLSKVEEGTTQEVIGDVQKLVSEKRPAAQILADLEKRRTTAASQRYPREYELPMNTGPVIGNLRGAELRPALNAAMHDASAGRQFKRATEIKDLMGSLSQVDKLRNEAEALRLEARHAGTSRNAVRMKGIAKIEASAKDLETQARSLEQHIARNKLTAGTLDMIQTAIQRMAKSEAEKGNATRQKFLLERAKALDDYMAEAPQLKNARDTHRIYSEMIDGVKFGEQVFKTSRPDEVIGEFNKMNKGAAQMARVGFRSRVEQLLSTGTGAEIKNLATNPGTKKIITAMFGQTEAERISRTASLRMRKLANARAAAGGGAPQASMHPVGFAHTPVGAAKHLAASSLAKAYTGLSHKEAASVAALAQVPARRALSAIERKPKYIRREKAASGSLRRSAGHATSSVLHSSDTGDDQ